VSSNIGALEKFKDDLMKHLNIKRDEIRVYERCKQFVKSYSNTWERWGLLHKKGDGLKRTEAFDEALRLQKARWIAEVRDLAPETGLDESSAAEKDAGSTSKRVSPGITCHPLCLMV
jgi:hypothetical protein